MGINKIINDGLNTSVSDTIIEKVTTKDISNLSIYKLNKEYLILSDYMLKKIINSQNDVVIGYISSFKIRPIQKFVDYVTGAIEVTQYSYNLRTIETDSGFHMDKVSNKDYLNYIYNMINNLFKTKTKSHANDYTVHKDDFINDNKKQLTIDINRNLEVLKRLNGFKDNR